METKEKSKLKEPNELKEKSTIIKYSNSFNEQKEFNKLTGKEQDLFFAIVAKLIEENTNREKNPNNKNLGIVVKPQEVKKIVGLNKADKHRSNESLSKMLDRITDVVNGIKCTLRSIGRDPNTNEIIYTENHQPLWVKSKDSIFADFKYGENAPYVIVKLRDEAQNFFFAIAGGFTQFFLKNYISISSPHAKAIYRQLLNGSNALKKEWSPTKEELMDWLNIEKENTFKKFKKKLPDYIKQIEKTGDFKGKIIYYYIYGKRKAITNIVFKYQLKDDRMKIIQDIENSPAYNQDKMHPIYTRIVKNGKVRKEAYHCKQCNGQVYSYTDKNGKAIAICENSNEFKLGNRSCTYKNQEKDLQKEDLWIENLDNATPENNNNNITPEKKKIPTLEEVQQYFDFYKQEKNLYNNASAENFYDYYEGVGWKANREPIENWKAIARVWIRKEKDNTPTIETQNQVYLTPEQQNQKDKEEAEKIGWNMN